MKGKEKGLPLMDKQEPKRYTPRECGHHDMLLSELGKWIFADDPAYLSLKRDAEMKKKLDWLLEVQGAVQIYGKTPDVQTVDIVIDGKWFTGNSLTEAIEQVKS